MERGVGNIDVGARIRQGAPRLLTFIVLYNSGKLPVGASCDVYDCLFMELDLQQPGFANGRESGDG